MFSSQGAPQRKAHSRSTETTVAVDDLRVGMFIHLDGGWLSHPFARSSFRIANAQQIATLRGLKLERVRCSPELDDPAAPDAGAPTAGAAPQNAGAGVVDAGGQDDAGKAEAATEAAAHGKAAPHVPRAGAPTGPARAGAPRPGQAGQAGHASVAAKRAATLAAERQAQRQCEQQFAEAASAWRQAGASLPSDPAAARAGVGALADALASKLLTDGDVGIRLLPAAVNDRAAAHALNVTVVSMLLARALGLPREDLADLTLGALLHDIGKLELPERVRHVEAGFSAGETQAYREHVARGLATGRLMALPEGALAVIAQHHEHADASGFPQRLGVERLTLAGRIVAIVNRYDNLCNPATRTPPLTPHEAVAMLFAHGRTRYDASVLNAFIRMMGVYPAGSLVQLTDGRYAMVVAVNSTRPLKPRVLVHESGVPRSEALLLDLEHEPDLGIRRSLPTAKVPAAALQYLDPRPRVAYFFEPLSAPDAPDRPAARPEFDRVVAA